MRILYISGTDDARFRGGIEAYGNGLIAGIRARGHAVALLETGPADVYAKASWRDYWPAAPFRERYYFWKRYPHEDYRYQVALRRQTRALIRSFRPDVIHSLHPYRLGAAIASPLPLMVSTYGLDVHQIPPVLGSLRRANVIHAISDFTAGLVKAVYPEVPRLEVIRWGIAQHYGPTPAEPEFDIITVSRLVRRKNVDTVLKAIASIGDLRYAVVGDGPEMNALRELAASLNLNHVTFFGSVPDAVRQALLGASRLFVMSPRTEPGDVEGLGLVYYEALGAGLPLIASDGGGAPEAVGDAGIVVRSPEDPAEVANGIRRALEPSNYARLKAVVAARQRDDTWDAFINRFERVYEELRAGGA